MSSRCIASFGLSIALAVIGTAAGAFAGATEAPATEAPATEATAPADWFESAELRVRYEGVAAEHLDAVEIEIRGVPDGHGRVAETSKGTFSCARLEAKPRASSWSCSVPSAMVDLVVRPRGFAPRFVWGLALDAVSERTDKEPVVLGPWRLEAGATVSGRVEGLPGSAAQVRVGLRARVTGFRGDPRTGSRRDLKTVETRLDPSPPGVGASESESRALSYQLGGVAPGLYTLSLEQDGAAPWRRDIALEDGEALHLEPARLVPPARIEVVLTPPMVPDGTAWIVALLALDPAAGRLRAVDELGVDSDGVVRFDDLTPGEYWLRVQDVHGDAWHNESLIVSDSDLVDGEITRRFLDLPLVEVEGTISRGDEPLAETTLVFGGGQGPVQRRTTSDRHGRFALTLPREGQWAVDLEEPALRRQQTLEPVDVRRRRGSSRAHLEIELPDTVVRGVVLHDGVPVPEAGLTVVRWQEEAKRRESILVTDDEGRFEILGTEPGQLVVRAHARGLQSAWSTIQVVEDLDPPDLELHLEALREVVGMVRYRGVPASGVRVVVRAVAAGETPNLSRSVFTDAAGRFRAELPAAVTQVDLLATAAGTGALIVRRGVPREGQGRIELDLPVEFGRLELAPAALGPDATLHRAGAALPVAFLLSALQGEVEWLEDRLVVPGVAPGSYELCAASRCEGGTLYPRATLGLLDVGPLAADDTSAPSRGAEAEEPSS